MTAVTLLKADAPRATILERGAAIDEFSDLSAPRQAKSVFPTLAEIPQKFLPPEINQREYLVNGELRRWNGKMAEAKSPLTVVSPDGTEFNPTLGTYPWMDSKAALETLSAAKSAYDGGLGKWPLMTPTERITCVEKFLEGMQGARDQVVNLIMWEIGKSLPDAQKEFDRTVEYVRESIRDLKAMDEEGKRVATNSGIASRVERNPLGVVLCVGPFNYPLNETFTTLMPALLMGNTVVFKTPKTGVLLYQPILKAFKDAFPPGVVNTIYGDGKEVITPIMQDGSVDTLAFIGSIGAADAITKMHKAPHRLHSVLGLGAKNPGIILPDADLTRAVDECAVGALSFNGQRCTALKILFVHRSIADEFATRLADKVSKLKQGMPWTPGVQITPLAEPGKVEWMRKMMDDAVVHGARVMNTGGGEASQALFTPAVLYPVSPKAMLYKDEQFGPLVPIVPFDNVSEVVTWLKDSAVGQQLSVFGADRRALADIGRETRNLVARINVNTQCQRGPDVLPFTGRKSSGLATLSIRDALKAFSIETVYAGKDESLTREWLSAGA